MNPDSDINCAGSFSCLTVSERFFGELVGQKKLFGHIVRGFSTCISFPDDLALFSEVSRDYYVILMCTVADAARHQHLRFIPLL